MATLNEDGGAPADASVVLARLFGWVVVGLVLTFVLNTYLTLWLGFPGALPTLSALGGSGEDAASPVLGVLQAALYATVLAASLLFVLRGGRSLRQDAHVMSGMVTYIVRAGFWAVLFVGLADMLVSFLRVEALLEAVVGPELATELGRSQFRGSYVHVPLIILAILLAARTRTLGVHWLALLVVAAELSIVISRFIFSYEQAFQGDLVRFWYAALFLFASAYTLVEDGHVRVDVIYAGMSSRGKGVSNAIGCVFLGLVMTTTILVFGLWDKSSVITSPLLSFEVSQSGFGMYVKYWMAGFLALFAVTMTIQFASYFLESIADIRGEPGHHEGSHAIS